MVTGTNLPMVYPRTHENNPFSCHLSTTLFAGSRHSITRGLVVGIFKQADTNWSYFLAELDVTGQVKMSHLASLNPDVLKGATDLL